MVTREQLLGTKMKIPNPEICKRVQERLFQLGFAWHSLAMKDNYHNNTEIMVHIYIGANGDLGWGIDDKAHWDYYKSSSKREISYKELITGEADTNGNYW